jgi:glutathione reductase (NADPH)
MSLHYDLFVIGGGSGGVRASRMAAATGAKVGIAESYRWGGTCVIRGCVPKKLFSYASHFGEDLHDAAGYGWSLGGSPSFDWGTLMAAKNKEIDRLERVYEANILVPAGVEVHRGTAKLTGPNRIDLDGKTITADKILIAVGGHPTRLPIPGAELALTSNELFELQDFPSSLLVYGSGYIAVEFAGIMQGLGADVTLAFRADKMLRGFDEDIRDHLTQMMTNKGVTIRPYTTLEALSQVGGGIEVAWKEQGETLASGRFDQVLMATGRRPNTHNLGLEAVGVATNAKGAIEVDQHFETSVPGIYALGDVIDRVQLTPVAIGEAMAFVDTHFKGKPRRMDYSTIATAVFSDPNVGTIGLSEEEARAQGYEVAIYRSTGRAMKYVLPDRDEKMLMKLIVCKESDRVLGLHFVGPDAGEIVQGFAVAMKMGATKADFDATVGIHPTAAEELVTMRTPV